MKIEDFEAFLAEEMASVLTELKQGKDSQDSADAVTRARKLAHILTSYCGEGPLKFLSGAWDEEEIRRFLRRQSRFNRCEADFSAQLHRDSVLRWEFDMAHDLVSLHQAYKTAGALGKGDAQHRIALERYVVVYVLSLYCGEPVSELFDMSEREELPYMTSVEGRLKGSPSLLRDTIGAGRPTY